MRARDVIAAKRDGKELAEADLRAFVLAVARGEVPDYQAAAFLMAAYLRGLSPSETIALTGAMIDSGARLDFAGLPRPTVDKHSTGGVGDKPSLVVGPLVAACGAAVPMLAGRGLGFTGGTLDKLEAIPGFRVDLSRAEFEARVRDVGVAIAGQTGEMVPADRTLYALRDATATVESIPLITASIVSKKVAEGTRNLLMDVKVGRGALIEDRERARLLARSILDAARGFGLRARALITDMDSPLGRWVGNAGEAAEAIEVLEGRGDARLRELCLLLAGHMLDLAGVAPSPEEGVRAAEAAIRDGRGLAVFERMIAAQGGRLDGFRPWSPKAKHRATADADRDGYVAAIDARAVGEAAMALGAGREKAGDRIDPEAAIEVLLPVGERVRAGDPVLAAYASDRARLAAVLPRLRAGLEIAGVPPEARPLLLEIVE